MNMIVTNTAPLLATVTNQGANGKSASSESNAFAGALVQAIGGQTTTEPSSGSPVLPTSLAAFLGQLGIEETEDGQEDSLLAALAEWLGKLADSSEEDLSSEDGQEKLSDLLAALQALLLQTAAPVYLSAEASTGEDAASLATSAETEGGQDAGALLLLQGLADALKNNDGKVDAKQLASIADQLKQLIASGNASTAASASGVNAQASQAVEPTRVGMLPIYAVSGALQQASAQAAQQSSAVDVRKPASFKEPVLIWNLIQGTQPTDREADASVVQAAGESSSADDSQTSLAWMLQSQDAATRNSDTAAAGAKPALPAQVPVQQFSQQIGNYLVRQFVLSGGNGITEARITLTPEHLGQVDVRLSMQDGQLTAQFLTHSGTAKDLIENQMGLLRSALQNQGIQVEKIEVVQQPYEASESASFLGDQDRGSNPDARERRADQRLDDGNQDTISFEDELERTTLIREAGFGGAINTTA
ncbi:flagellar hook-length control protein FliK [Cohnella fermenti]|nr:flagellar hook-length control protein FliK [Cohnella fermenti]